MKSNVQKLQALVDVKECNPQRMRELEVEIEEMRIARRSDMARIDDLIDREKRARLQRDQLDVELKAVIHSSKLLSKALILPDARRENHNRNETSPCAATVEARADRLEERTSGARGHETEVCRAKRTATERT